MNTEQRIIQLEKEVADLHDWIHTQRQVIAGFFEVMKNQHLKRVDDKVNALILDVRVLQDLQQREQEERQREMLRTPGLCVSVASPSCPK